MHVTYVPYVPWYFYTFMFTVIHVYLHINRDTCYTYTVIHVYTYTVIHITHTL